VLNTFRLQTGDFLCGCVQPIFRDRQLCRYGIHSWRTERHGELQQGRKNVTVV